MPKKRKSASAGPAGPTLRQAPKFTPSADEFSNPLRYILSIREEAEKYGICCIQPPPEWKPPFMIDLNKLKFPTRVQKINELLVRKVQRVKFLKDLAEFSDAAGRPLTAIPAIDGREIDLHLLHTHVTRLGGFERVTSSRKWVEVAEAMNMHGTASQQLSGALKKHYQALLLPYDQRDKSKDPVADKPAASAAAASAGGSSGGSLMSRRAVNAPPPAGGDAPSAGGAK